MSAACQELHRFLDGELEPAAAEAFRLHLGVCSRCPAELERACTVDALAEETLSLGRRRTVEVPAAADQVAAVRARRRRFAAACGVGLAAAAALALLVGRPATRSQGLAVLVQGQRYRGVEGRLDYPGLDAYQPLVRDRGRGAIDPRVTREQVLADLERRGDHHGLAVALMIDGRLDEAARQLALAPPTVGALVDGAALALERQDPRAALALADRALAREPANRAALWNRAVALRALGDAGAAAVFRAIAARGEPGWSDEARRRAADDSSQR